MDERGYAKGRAKRTQILDTAVTLFGEVGYRATSLRDIAAQCGITHQGLLHHFPTKQALLLAVLERRDENSLSRTHAGQPTGAQELARIVEVVADNATRPHIVELFATLSTEAVAPDHPAHEYFQDRYARVLAALTATYELARAEGSLRAGIDSATAARQLVALMDGLQIQWLYTRDALDMAAIVSDHLSGQLRPTQATPPIPPAPCLVDEPRTSPS